MEGGKELEGGLSDGLGLGIGVAVGVGEEDGVGAGVVAGVGDGKAVGGGVDEDVGDGDDAGADVSSGNGGKGIGTCDVSATKLAGTIKGGRGFWEKLKAFTMLLAVRSLAPSVGRLKFSSASLRREPNSYSVWSMWWVFAQGEITKVGTRKPLPKASICGGATWS